MSASILMLIARIALGICLYGFLGLTLVYLWHDLRTAPRILPAGPARETVRLLDADGTVRREFPLTKDSCFLGRSATVEIRVPDDTVSAVHARLWKSGGRWRLEDLHSRNGTFLNGIPAEKGMVLCPGDRIRIGRCILEFAQTEPGLPQNSSPVTSPLPPANPPSQEAA